MSGGKALLSEYAGIIAERAHASLQASGAPNARVVVVVVEDDGAGGDWIGVAGNIEPHRLLSAVETMVEKVDGGRVVRVPYGAKGPLS